VGQCRNIKTLTDLGLLKYKKSKRSKAQKKSCNLAFTYSSEFLVKPTKDYGIKQAKTIYFSKETGQLLIAIDFGVSYLITPNLNDFVGPI
jgi:hypothetical protein